MVSNSWEDLSVTPVGITLMYHCEMNELISFNVQALEAICKSTGVASCDNIVTSLFLPTFSQDKTQWGLNIYYSHG